MMRPVPLPMLYLWSSLAASLLLTTAPVFANEHGEKKESGEKPAEKNGEAKVREDDLHYLRLRGITATVYSDGAPAGALDVDIYLDLKDPGKKAEFQALEPRLRDRFIQKLTPLARTRISIYRPVDLDMIGAALQSATDAVLGGGMAQVLISSAGIHRF